jgi:hypothetical protein
VTRSERPEQSPRSDGSALYERAAGVGKDALDDQVSELDSMRNRSVQFLAFVGSATAFLVGTSLNGAVPRGPGFGITGALGTLGILALLVILRSILTGTANWFGGAQMNWNYRLDPTAYTEWLDEQGSRVSAEVFYRHLAGVYRTQKVANEEYLKVIRARYFAFLVSSTSVLLIWGVVAWRYGGS